MSADQREADAKVAEMLAAIYDSAASTMEVDSPTWLEMEGRSDSLRRLAAYARAPLAPVTDAEVEALIAAATDYGHSLHAGLQSEVDRDEERVNAAKKALLAGRNRA